MTEELSEYNITGRYIQLREKLGNWTAIFSVGTIISIFIWANIILYKTGLI